MKIKLKKAEWYPVHMPDEEGQEYEIPADVWERYQAALMKFREMRSILGELTNDLVFED